MSNYDEFVELLHCIFLVHPQKVAQEFEPHVDILQDIVESISLEPGETPAFDPSPEDDEDSIADYVEFLMGAFATDPGDVMRAFWGHEAFLNGVIGVIEGGEAPTATRVTADDLADDMDVVCGGMHGSHARSGFRVSWECKAAQRSVLIDCMTPP